MDVGGVIDEVLQGLNLEPNDCSDLPPLTTSSQIRKLKSDLMPLSSDFNLGLNEDLLSIFCDFDCGPKPDYQTIFVSDYMSANLNDFRSFPRKQQEVLDYSFHLDEKRNLR